MSAPAPSTSAAGSRRAVASALIANVAIALAKGVAAALTGSAALVAETLHSVADAGNQVLLAIALRRGGRPADAGHPLGHDTERYFWALLAAVGIFVVGGVLSIWEGVSTLLHGRDIEALWIGLAVLAVALALDGWSLSVSVRELRKRTRNLGVPVSTFLRHTPDTTLTAVLLEDTVDVLGAVLAISALLLHDATGSPLPDGLASIAIGLLLGLVAAALARRSRDLLSLQAVPELLFSRARTALAETPGVHALGDVSAVWLGPDHVLVTGTVRLDDGLDGAAAAGALAEASERVRQSLGRPADVFLTPIA